MDKEIKNEQAGTATLPALGARLLLAADVPPLRRVTIEDVRKVEALLRQRRSTR